MSRLLGSVRVALRIAARDALAHKLRSALVMVLVGLPVLVVTAGLVVFRTADVSDVEALDRELGNADAYVQYAGDARVEQDVSPFYSGGWWVPDEDEVIDGGGASLASEADTADLTAVLGADTRLVPYLEKEVSLRRDDGEPLWFTVHELDLRDEVTAPLFTLAEGRLPAGTDEVVVNEGLSEEGYGIGDVLPVSADRAPTVVGVGEDADTIDGAVAYGLSGSLVADPDPRRDEVETGWFVQTGDVSWDDVTELNQRGYVVASRSVIADPPDPSEIDGYFYTGEGPITDQDAAVIGLVAVMVLLEVVLLAGPAFAVTARRQARTLALVATAGGTPAQARRVVVAQGAVLGLAASLVGVVLGVVTGVAATPVVQHLDDYRRFGPLDVPWPWIAGVALCGVLAVLLAAVFPAWVTARQDPVAALAGRRSDPSPRLRHPLAGLVLVAVGVAGTVYATTRADNGEWFVAASAVVVVLGMVLVVPVLLVTVSKVVGELPFAVRFSARDAARHRARTVPAVVAVAATVAGVVALGTSVASETAQSERMYSPSAPTGSTTVSWDTYGLVEGDARVPAQEAFDRIEPLLAEVAGEEPVRLRGLVGDDDPEQQRMESWDVLTDASQTDGSHLQQYSMSYGSSVIVSDDVQLLALDDEEMADEAAAALAAGKVVVPTHQEVDGDTVVLRRTSTAYEYGDGEGRKVLEEHVLPAHYLQVRGEFLPSPTLQALVPTAVAEEDGLPVVDTTLYLADGLDRDQEKAAAKKFHAEQLWAVGISTERGFEDSSDTPIVLLVMGVGAWALMLVGTLTAAFLALSDARGDLATLGAVGGEPRVRRRVAGAYAWLVAGLGAVLGAAIGLVPGVAMAVLQRQRVGSWYVEVIGDPPPLVLDVPWLLVLAVVVGLPLLTAAVMWASARSRLPLVARVE